MHSPLSAPEDWLDIGRVLDLLHASGQLDNPLVIVLSDNRAEPTELATLVEKAFSPEAKRGVEADVDQGSLNCGRKGSAVDDEAAWAQVGSTPLEFFRTYAVEGGKPSPVIFARPGVKPGATSSAVLHVTDLVPTFVQVAGAQHPAVMDSNHATLQGMSLTQLLAGTTSAVRTANDLIGEELLGNRMIRLADSKISCTLKSAGGKGEWELFDIQTDPGDTRDLSNEAPQRFKALLALWPATGR